MMRLIAFVTSTCHPGEPPSTRHAVSGVEDGLQSSCLHLARVVRLSHERVGQSITSFRAHGSEQCRFRACALHLFGGLPGEAAIDVLMPFHSMTTTDSVKSINGGLAEDPSEVLSPPSPSPKAAGSRVWPCRCVSPGLFLRHASRKTPAWTPENA